MTDNDIIKALECCTKGTTSDVCDDCPLRTTDICTEEENGVLKLALDLINSQKAEIEALIAGQETLQRYISTAKAEAIKEFAERLKEYVESYDVTTGYRVTIVQAVEEETIDNLVKEMVGEG